VQAETEEREQARSAALRGDVIREIRALNERMDTLEGKVQIISRQLGQ
jgi:hypothetical protein